MDFKKWLEKERKEYLSSWLMGVHIDCNEEKIAKKVFENFVQALGEWAWDNLSNTAKIGEAKGIRYGYYSDLWKIAYGCLGKKEVKKRLKEAGKNG